jgi:hypothetical protein
MRNPADHTATKSPWRLIRDKMKNRHRVVDFFADRIMMKRLQRGRLAQGLEHLPYTQGAVGSNPPPPTRRDQFREKLGGSKDHAGS